MNPPHIRYPHQYTLRDNKKIATEKFDKNTIIFVPDEDERYSTMIKKNGDFLNVYSTGLRLKSLKVEGSNLVFSIGVEDILTVKEFDLLNEFVDMVNKPNPSILQTAGKAAIDVLVPMPFKTIREAEEIKEKAKK